jgi:hypothetical protein
MRKAFLSVSLTLAFVVVACRHKVDANVTDDASTDASALAADASVTGETLANAPRAAGEVATADGGPGASGDKPKGPCPDDMVYVDTEFCPKVERECLEVEQDHTNHLKICHEYAKGKQKCLTKTEHRQFCIDPYEFPNKKGGHPAWNATWYEAQASCEAHGKRLCWGSEWTAACEGPEHTPFPYGWKRDHNVCNIDSFYITPEKKNGNFLFSSKDPEVRHDELSRLDQSVPSGSMEGCKSGFGVYDQTGNFDEWAISDEKPIEKSRWAALKGGAWGHVRNQCRPASHNHMPDEWYYFWSFRCCKDAEGAPVWHPPADAGNVPAPEVAAVDHFVEPIVPKNAPGPSKTKYDYREEKRRNALRNRRADAQ